MAEWAHYVGSKFGIADWILSYFPQHECYVEVFGGTGAVLINKQKSKLEIYNDLDADLANLVMMIKMQPSQLRFALAGIPASRGIYQTWLAEWKAGNKGRTDMERAARFFYLLNNAFSGTFGRGFARPGYRSSGSWKSNEYPLRIDAIEDFSKRLMDVVVENLDFQELIRRYDSPSTLFYCDPPYSDLRDADFHYNVPFPPEDIERLSSTLHNIQGKVIVSGYPGRFDELFMGWKRAERETLVHADGQHDRKATEVLWMNYDIEQHSLFMQSRLPVSVSSSCGD